MFFSLLFLALASITSIFSQQNYENIQDLATTPILSPTFQNRETMKLRLPNGLEAYIVSDPNLDQSSVALSVKTGSWGDPQEFPGIAHFLEHMLFLGTGKYPAESEFEGFVAEHNGQTNAFTSIDMTSYVFSINTNAFSEALDRFAQFFIDPLFNPSGVARELQAIDQEYAKNRENDDIREYYVYKELANPDHPHRAFSMGNKNTLRSISRESLKQWYLDNYSANRMKLIVHSSLPLEELKNRVVTDFQDITNRNLEPLNTAMEMMRKDVKGHMIIIEPVTQMQRLSLIWNLPSKFGAMDEIKPEFLICEILSNEGEGSLLKILKRMGFAENIRCDGEKLGSHQFEFVIEIGLTPLGVKEINKVILTCFQALASLKKTGIPRYLFDEFQQTAILSYQYQERENDFENILKEASWIVKEDLATYPERTFMIKKFDSQAVSDFLSYLMPETCIYSLIAPAALTKIVSEHKERWFNTAYTVKSIPEDVMKQWSLATPLTAFALPRPNPFLPEKLQLVGRSNRKSPPEQIPHPEVVVDNEAAKIYFSKDVRYLIPKISWIFTIKTPAIDIANPESIVLGDLYVKHLNDALSSDAALARQAGLDVVIARKNNGISINIDGYNEKANKLLLEIIKSLQRLVPEERSFKIFKNSLMKKYQNIALLSPIQQAYDAIKSIIYQEYTTEKAKAAAIKKITFDQFEQFIKSIFSISYVEGMFYGNMSKTEAHDLALQALSLLDSRPYLKKDQHKEAVIVLPDNQGPYYLEYKTKTEGNAAALLIECLPYTFSARAAQQVLMQAMKDPFFAALRTQQQTGYIVLSQADEFELHLFNIFLVQSHTHDGRDLLSRFELFIEDFLQEMAHSISKQRFQNIKEALLKSLRQPPKNISEMGALLSLLAFKYDGDFNWIAKRIKGLENLSYEDFIDMAKKFMGKGNKRRLGILLKGMIPDENTLNYQKMCSLMQLQKFTSYEASPYPIYKK